VNCRHRLLLVFLVVLIGRVLPGAAPAYVERIDSLEAFRTVSVEEHFRPDLLRVGKYLAPAVNDPQLLPTVFQNVNIYPRHLEFMAREFPDHFPSLTPEEYLDLVERRARRKYWAGSIYQIAPATGDCRYGFTVFTERGVPGELPTEQEIADLHKRLSESFTLGELCYVPSGTQAEQEARSWKDPPFGIYFLQAAPELTYEAYTTGTAYGRVRLLNAQEAEEASRTGKLSWQDIVVIKGMPAFLESVVAAIVTTERQGELSHLNVRAALRGTPNVFMADAWKTFEPFEGKLVRVSFGPVSYNGPFVASEGEAQEFWNRHRPRLEPPPQPDFSWKELTSFEEMTEPRSELVKRFGAKAANLAVLQRCLLPDRRLRGFAVPYFWYDEFLRSNTILDRRTLPPKIVPLKEYIDSLLASTRFQTDPAYRAKLLSGFRETMERRAVVDPTLVASLIQKIKEVFGSTEVMVRFRSSSNVEDNLLFNGAGLYDSTSACAADSTDADDNGPSHCDPTRPEERPISRALRKVWASLWNFRAFEERDYYGLPHDRAAMAIVVTPAFPREAANGVVFTGNPLDRRDKRFLVNVQQGSASVVNPDPEVVPEKDLLEVKNGRVEKIIRVRPSSLVAPGTYVLTDSQLQELGAVVASAASCFPVDPGPFDPDRVILDFEFKFTPEGRLVIKQVRPFLVREWVPAGPVFRLVIPEGAAFEGVNLFERSLDTEERLLSAGRFRAGTFEIPVTGAPVSADIIAELAIGSPDRTAVPLAEGAFTVQAPAASEPEGTYTVTYKQRFKVQEQVYELVIDRLRFSETQPRDTLVLDDRYLSLTGDFLPGLQMYAFPVDRPDDIEERIFFAGAGYPALPLYHVSIEAGEERIELWYRLLRLLEPTATGPANLVRAAVRLKEGTQEVKDYWRLVYSARIHNTRQKFRLILDPPLGAVSCIDVYEPFEDIIAARVILRSAERSVLRELEVTKYRQDGPFLRGDADGDGRFTVSDGITILHYLFGAQGPVKCLDALDTDDSGSIELPDVILLLRHLFTGGPPPAPPFDSCMPDPTPEDPLDCRIYKPCGLF